MSKANKKSRARNPVALGMLLTCKSKKFSHKNDRRAKDARKVRETFGEG